MSKLKTLKDCLIDELKDLYSAEKQLVKALPKMEKKAANESLKKAFKMHLEETKKQIDRLDEVSSILDQKLSGKTCKAMKGLVEEGSEILKEESENEALIDILLVGAAQRIEHYEISAYGTTIAIAEELEMNKVVKLLSETIKEEGAADEKLTKITKSELFPEAMKFEEDGEEGNDLVPPKKKSKGKESMHAALVGAVFIAGSILSNSNVVNADHTPEHSTARSSMKAENDNTEVNALPTNKDGITAQDQSNNSDDLKVLAEIRKTLTKNDSLSVNAQNVKIIVNNGEIFLKGPVNSQKEKDLINSVAAKVAPHAKIFDGITIAH